MFKSFQFIYNAVKNKKYELFVSLILVMVLLLMASTIMYFLERNAQPEAFSNIVATMWWGVATLTTVGYGDIYPITALGKLMGGVIAILGVGLFALPAGIIASGFVEEIENDRNIKKLKEQEKQLKEAFEIEYFNPLILKKKALNMEAVPRKWISMADANFKLGFSESTVFDIANFSNHFRLCNIKINSQARTGIELMNCNRTYGQYLDRKSDITVVNMHAASQTYFGHFTQTIAQQLNANHISNEVYNNVSFLKEKRLNLISNPDYLKASSSHEAIQEIKKDLSLLKKSDVCIFILPASDDKETLFQFNTGAELGDSTFKNGPFFKEPSKLDIAFNKAAELAKSHELTALKHEKTGKPEENHLAWYIHQETENNLLILKVNVKFLKKKMTDYYQFIHDLSNCLLTI